jgi:uncharacterized protein (DUF2336 family)
MLNWVLGGKGKARRKKPGIGRKPNYERAKAMAAKGSLAERRRLAGHEDLEPEILYYFAEDVSAEVRREVAEELKNATNVPKRLIRRLAEDLEHIVSVPVLEYSPLLNDGDLIEIIARGMEGRALLAVARRRGLAEPVVDAVVATDDAAAVEAVLENPTARIGEDGFDVIATKAEANTRWHNAMVFRDDLPVRTVRRIASFVSAALMELLIERNASQEDLVAELRKTVCSRIEKGDFQAEEADQLEPASDRAEKDFRAGRLDDEVLAGALADGDNAYVRYSLVFLSKLPAETVSRMLNAGSPKSITALAWKAGVGMEVAVALQERIGRIKSANLLRPTAEGEYPLSQDDIDWYSERFFD